MATAAWLEFEVAQPLMLAKGHLGRLGLDSPSSVNSSHALSLAGLQAIKGFPWGHFILPWESGSYRFFFFLFLFYLFRAAPVAYGSSQARGRTGAAAASLHHSQGNTGSELHI